MESSVKKKLREPSANEDILGTCINLTGKISKLNDDIKIPDNGKQMLI